ncbi:MAG: phosphoenolpyruvate--protein phosphotransferase [Myxococcales bacterium]|nr:phosphoenolpyruvate--protein phosphotransferase [Myxococcales bacterium]
MDVRERLVTAIEQAHSPADALAAASAAIEEELGAAACSIFLSEHGSPLHLEHHRGAREDAVRARHAADALAGQAFAEVAGGTDGGASYTALAVPMAARGRPIGVIVVQRPGTRGYGPAEVQTLVGIAAQMVGVVASARFIARVERVAGRGELSYAPPASKPPTPSTTERVLSGIAASPGVAIGAAVFRRAFPHELVRQDTSYRGARREEERVREAFAKTRDDLHQTQTVAAATVGEEQALIFSAHLMLLGDPVLESWIADAIASGQTASVAIDAALDEFMRRLREVRDPYLQERVDDVEDLRTRLLGHLLAFQTPESLHAQVVVSPRATPSLVMEARAQGALGIVSESGGATSHGVLLARSLGLPAVTGVGELMTAVPSGATLAVDGDAGVVVLRPSAARIASYRERQNAAERRRSELRSARGRPVTTADGVRVHLQANIALGGDLELAREHGAEGIGLYRTEFPFMVREGYPTREEQVRIYAAAYRAFPDGPVTLRVLDLAGDKLVPASGATASASPFHGYRSIRVLFDDPDVLRDQAQAFALAAGEHPLRILVPMVTSVEDFQRIKTSILAALGELPDAAHRPAPKLGAMIEVPAAVELAAELAEEADFFSIGTNDLIQYTLVVDREDPRMASPLDPYHPAILRMIRRVVAAAHAAGREVGVCGEMAGRPDLALALLALGIDTLSVTPRVIPELAHALGRSALGPLRAHIGELLALRTATALREALAQACAGASPSRPAAS